MVGSDIDIEAEWARWRMAREDDRRRKFNRRMWRFAILLGVGFYFFLMVAVAWSTDRDLFVPDLAITPGAVTAASVDEVCHTHWGHDRRHVTAAMKRETFARYGLSGNKDAACGRDRRGRRCEIDHVVPRELGGADVIENLWPQPYSGAWNASMKDKVENRLHKDVCAGLVPLEAAQREMMLDWRIPYQRYFGLQ